VHERSPGNAAGKWLPEACLPFALEFDHRIALGKAGVVMSWTRQLLLLLIAQSMPAAVDMPGQDVSLEAATVRSASA